MILKEMFNDKETVESLPHGRRKNATLVVRIGSQVQLGGLSNQQCRIIPYVYP